MENKKSCDLGHFRRRVSLIYCLCILRDQKKGGGEGSKGFRTMLEWGRERMHHFLCSSSSISFQSQPDLKKKLYSLSILLFSSSFSSPSLQFVHMFSTHLHELSASRSHIMGEFWYQYLLTFHKLWCDKKGIRIQEWKQLKQFRSSFSVNVM